MNNLVKSYLIIDKTYDNLEILKKYMFLIINKDFTLTKIQDGLIKVSFLEKEDFIKICLSIKTIKNDLNLNKLLLVETPFYKDSLKLVLKSNESGHLSLYELLLQQYKNNDINLDFVKDVFFKVDKYIFETAKVYIDLEESVHYTSLYLFTHRNTINYRISRFSELSGINLKNGKNILLTRFLIYLYEENNLGELL